MADEVDKKHLNDNIEDAKPLLAANRPVDVRSENSNSRNIALNRRGLIIGLVVLVVLALGLAGAAGFAVLNGTQQRLSERNGSGFTGSSMMYRESGFGRGRTVQTEVSDGTVTTTVYNYLTGVVVAVNSDNIVVAGNGKQTTIKTNSSTTYVGNKPVVNDTVTIANRLCYYGNRNQCC
jgi:hypothetical protein